MWSIMIYEAFPKPNKSCYVLNHIDYSFKVNQLMAIFNLELKKKKQKQNGARGKNTNVDSFWIFAGALTGEANSNGPLYQAAGL